MRRTQIAIVLLSLFILISAIGHIIVFQTVQKVNLLLDSAYFSACNNKYQHALQQTERLKKYFQKQLPVLKIYLRQDVLSELQIALDNLPVLASKDSHQEFISETVKVKSRFGTVKKTFFSVL